MFLSDAFRQLSPSYYNAQGNKAKKAVQINYIYMYLHISFRIILADFFEFLHRSKSYNDNIFQLL
jgi:hypothetical protein